MYNLIFECYLILEDFYIVISKKIIALMKMCLNSTYNNVPIGIYFLDKLPIQNGLKQGDALSPVFFIFVLEYADWNGLKLSGHARLWSVPVMIIHCKTYSLKRY
jgi:hypothetical protein